MGLGRWFGRSALPADIAAAVADLSRLVEQKPSLAAPAAVLQTVLSTAFVEPVREAVPAIEPAEAAERLSAGIPLLRGRTIAWHVPSLKRRWLAVCRAVKRHNASGGAALARAFADLDPAALLGEVLAGRPETVSLRADVLSLDASLTATVLRLSAVPVLARFAVSLRPLYESCAWDQGFCPVCGSWPLLGEFRGLEQTRVLRCGLCAAAWTFPRLRCPFCDNRDHHQLGFLHIEADVPASSSLADCRAATCDACRRCVKMVPTLGALSELQLLVKDVETLHLDLAAADRSYFGA